MTNQEIDEQIKFGQKPINERMMKNIYDFNFKDLEWLEQWMNESYIPNQFDKVIVRKIIDKSTRCTRSVLTALGVPLPDGPQRPTFGSGLLGAVTDGGYTLQALRAPRGCTVRAIYKDNAAMKKNLIVSTASHVFTMFACGIVVDIADFINRKPGNKIESLHEFKRLTLDERNAQLDREREYKERSLNMVKQIMNSPRF